jgi:hypothetical protein
MLSVVDHDLFQYIEIVPPHISSMQTAPYSANCQHELHLWIYYMSKFLNTSEFIIMVNSRHIWNLSE